MTRSACGDRLAFLTAEGLICLFWAVAVVISAPTPAAPSHGHGGIVKNEVLARVLGEALFRDTADVISETPLASLTAGPGPYTVGFGRNGEYDGQVARTLLARRPLDKYRWLIERSFADSLWKGDRDRIERNFPLIWRTSITLYEATLDLSQARVRVCAPGENIDELECVDRRIPARIVPIPADATILISAGRPNIG